MAELKATIGDQINTKVIRRAPPAEPTAEDLVMLETFFRLASTLNSNPAHNIAELAPQAVAKAREAKSLQAAFGVIESRRARQELRARFQDFAAGWQSRQSALKSLAFDASPDMMRAVKTAVRYFVQCWDGVVEEDKILPLAKLALVKLRVLTGTADEETAERGERYRNGG